MDCTTPESRGDGAITLLHEIAKHRREEGGGADVETLVAVNLRNLRMINRVWLAMRLRSGGLGHEQSAVKAFNILKLSAHLPYQGFIEIIFV